VHCRFRVTGTAGDEEQSLVGGKLRKGAEEYHGTFCRVFPHYGRILRNVERDLVFVAYRNRVRGGDVVAVRDSEKVKIMER
jgi:hypothetical protein